MKFIINYSYVRSNLYLVISGKEKAGIITKKPSAKLLFAKNHCYAFVDGGEVVV